MGEAEERLHGADVGVDGGVLDGLPISPDPHRLQRGLHTLDRGPAQPAVSQRRHEPLADPRVDPHGVGGAIAVALQPDLEQLPIRPGVGVEGGQPIDLGTEDLGLRRRDDFELGSGHRIYSGVF